MKLIFRRELGEEHLFVLWQKADNEVVVVWELLINVFLAVALLFLIFYSLDRPSNFRLALLGCVLVVNFYYQACLKKEPWCRPD